MFALVEIQFNRGANSPITCKPLEANTPTHSGTYPTVIWTVVATKRKIFHASEAWTYRGHSFSLLMLFLALGLHSYTWAGPSTNCSPVVREQAASMWRRLPDEENKWPVLQIKTHTCSYRDRLSCAFIKGEPSTRAGHVTPRPEVGSSVKLRATYLDEVTHPAFQTQLRNRFPWCQ